LDAFIDIAEMRVHFLLRGLPVYRRKHRQSVDSFAFKPRVQLDDFLGSDAAGSHDKGHPAVNRFYGRSCKRDALLRI
jgi:hypothetical protein